MIKRFLFTVVTFTYALLLGELAIAQAADPLPSWNDGKAKQSIIEFVEKVTKQGSPGFVPSAERIATFDNDGTLWAEQPVYFQLMFALDRVKALAPQHPEWKHEEPFASLLKGDIKGALAAGKQAILEIVMTTHADMTTEEFEKVVKEWITSAKHPETRMLYTDVTPMSADLIAASTKLHIAAGPS